MFTRRYGLILLLVIALVGTYSVLQVVQAASPEPGSEADPLVTKGYVEQYVNNYYKQLEKQADELSARVVALEKEVAALKGSAPPVSGKTIKLTIGSRTAYVGDQASTLQAAPLMAGNSVMLPFRFLGEVLGADVKWDATSKSISYVLRSNTLVLKIGSTAAQYNGQEIKLNIPPQLVNGITMVPVRVVSEYLGGTVNWDQKSQTITITVN